MANPQLSVEISAKIDGLRDSFNKAVREVGNFDKSTKQQLNSIDKGFEKLANDIDKEMNRAASSVNRGSNKISKDLAATAMATSKSKNTYLEFGRVLQDLPFGFTGIQNNLTQLVPAAGAAGLAFSALISALTFLQVGTDYWTRGLKDNKTALDNINKSGSEYLETLNQLNQFKLKGEQDSAKEIAQLKILFGAYQNANLPLKVRQEAYKDLQEQYPAYFKNIKFEQDASVKTTAAYNQLTQAILATGRARAAVDLIAKNETRKLENEQKIVDLEKQRTDFIAKQTTDFNKRADAQSKLYTEEQKSFRITEDQRKTQIGYISESDKVLSLNEKINNLKTDSSLLDKANLQLIKAVNVELVKGAEIIGSVGSLDKVKEIAKILNGRTLGQGGGQIKLNNEVAPTASIQNPRLLQFKGLNEYQKLMQAASASNDRFVESLNSVAKSALSSGIGDAFSAIGEAISNGTSVIDGFGEAIISAFSGFLAQLGQLFIKEGIAQVAYGIAKNIILPGSGATNIAGGAGMIAAGAGISVFSGALKGGKGKGSKQSNPVKQIPGFASGVNNFGGGLALVGERGAELVNLPTGSSVIPNDRTNRILSGNGGKQNVEIFGEVGFNMEQFVIRFRNAEKRLNRAGV